jgi:hypothetical protein
VAKGGGVTLEDEMKREIVRIESEIAVLDKELEKLQFRVAQILMRKRKLEHDLLVLRSHFEPIELKKEKQTNLASL